MERLLARASDGDEQAFGELTDPYRRELQLHCYRLLGSVQDAEDMLQETLLAAWRSLAGFERRASLRAWLYRIATNRCLNALRDSRRRPQREAPQPGFSFSPPQPTRYDEPSWLEPCPDMLLDAIPDAAPGPEARYDTKEAVGLSFVAGLQHLPPNQRAALVLRDVLGFRAGEVAEMLDTTELAVKGSLQRARAALAQRLPARDRERAPLPDSARERALVGAFADAFSNGDAERLVSLLTDDVWLTMPPLPMAYQGPEAVRAFFQTGFGALDGRRIQLIQTRANAQPAFGVYYEDARSPIARGMGLTVLTLKGERISAITRFEPSNLERFGLPRTLRGGSPVWGDDRGPIRRGRSDHGGDDRSRAAAPGDARPAARAAPADARVRVARGVRGPEPRVPPPVL
ncbi:MAG TPA: RNA polymerase subunit sigma-70 [Conexibacter sp.]|nr:RNA polymerase subunit sigma-70 [Conexibacter sp.]